MKILMISGDRLTPCGGRGPLWETQRGFSKHFERVDILLPRPDGPVTTRQILGNVYLHPSESGRVGLVNSWKRTGLQLLEEHGHELMVAHDYGLFMAGRACAWLSRRTGVPYLSEIHHVPGYPIAASWRERFECAATRMYLRWAENKACAFRVVNAGELAPLLEQLGVPREKILVLGSLYIDLEVFRPVATPPPREQDIVYAGRFASNKGLDKLIDALALLRSRGRDYRMLFIGMGPLEGMLRARARSQGVEDLLRIRGWTDSTAELADVYRRSGVVVCASSCEGGPRATVEGMACGIPTVSTKVGMMVELIKDGWNGWHADFTVPGLAQALDNVLADEAKRLAMGRNAHESVQRFDYQSTIDAYAAGMKQLARKRA